MSVFVDTSAFYGVVDDDDGHFPRAKELLTADEPLITTDFVLSETWRLVRDRLGHAPADRFWATPVPKPLPPAHLRGTRSPRPRPSYRIGSRPHRRSPGRSRVGRQRPERDLI